MSLATLKARLAAASSTGWEFLIGHRGVGTLSPEDWELVAHARDDLELAVRAFDAFHEHLAGIVELGEAQGAEGDTMGDLRRLQAARRRMDIADKKLVAVLKALEAAP